MGTRTTKKFWALKSGIEVQTNLDNETVTVRHNNDTDYGVSDAPDVRFVFSRAELRGMLALLDPQDADTWKDISDIEIYK